MTHRSVVNSSLINSPSVTADPAILFTAKRTVRLVVDGALIHVGHADLKTKGKALTARLVAVRDATIR